MSAAFTGNFGLEADHIILTRESSLVLYDIDGNILGRSNDGDSVRPAANFVLLQNDGNLVMYRDSGIVWTSNITTVPC